jgi:hypothetical protein
METLALDSLLESIAFENFTTNIHLAGLMNGNQSSLTPNNKINQKTDTLNRYFDNLINFDRECEKSMRKSSSPSSSDHSSDHQNNGRMPQVNSINSYFHCQCQTIIVAFLLP